jgi:hypothetical protein
MGVKRINGGEVICHPTKVDGAPAGKTDSERLLPEPSPVRTIGNLTGDSG